MSLAYIRVKQSSTTKLRLFNDNSVNDVNLQINTPFDTVGG